MAEFVLRDYNKKHGTKLEYVGLLPGKEMHFFGFGFTSDFLELPSYWEHFNFEARRVNAHPSDKPLVLFAELSLICVKFHLTTLSLVEPTDESYGCRGCLTSISHPRHGFRAGLNTSEAIEPKILSEEAAAVVAEFALQDYNKKQGTNIKFERALKCNSFTCTGLSMDFDEKNTDWVHLNFEARVGPREIVRLFAELYLGDDGKYVLATLSPAEPSDSFDGGKWKKKYVGVNECVVCPAEIRHPWRAYRYAFNHPPIGDSECMCRLPS